MSLLRAAAVSLLLTCVASCIKGPPLPAIDDVLPPSYDEHAVPDGYSESLGGFHETPDMWTRCFDCELDWNGLIAHIESVPALNGYRDATGDWVGVMGIADMPLDIRSQFVRVYASPDSPYLVILTNTAFARQAGMPMRTAGDFVITCGSGLFSE